MQSLKHQQERESWNLPMLFKFLPELFALIPFSQNESHDSPKLRVGDNYPMVWLQEAELLQPLLKQYVLCINSYVVEKQGFGPSTWNPLISEPYFNLYLQIGVSKTMLTTKILKNWEFSHLGRHWSTEPWFPFTILMLSSSAIDGRPFSVVSHKHSIVVLPFLRLGWR